MKCLQCCKKIQGDGVLLDADGDFVCDDKCKKDFEAEKEDFLNRICHSKQLTEDWLKGKSV
jgi:hypothetical protein